MRLIGFLLSVLWLLGTVLGQPAESREYKKDGVSFSYPVDWEVSEDSIYGERRLVIIEGPESGVMTVMIMESSEDVHLDELAREFSRGMVEEMPVGTVSSSGIRPAPPGEGDRPRLRESIEVNFLGVEVPHVREYTLFSEAGATVFLATQIAVEDWKAESAGLILVEETFQYRPSQD